MRNKEIQQHVISLLEQRGVKLLDMALILYDNQSKYDESLTLKHCEEVIRTVLLKTEVQNGIMLGIEIDKLHEKGLLEDTYLKEMISKDAGIFGLDEIIGGSLTYCYGTIALTNFGYLDKMKPRIIGRLDNSKKQTNVFLDDLVCGIVACACGKLAHNQ